MGIIPKCLFFILILNQFCLSQWYWANPQPQGNTILKIRFIDSSTGFIAGDFGKILKTTNGGEDWDFKFSKTEGTIYDLSFVDVNEGWGCCQSGVIIHTTDSGESWEIQESGRADRLYSIKFIDKNEGWSVGYSNNVFHTKDGGQNWSIENLGSHQAELKTVFFINEICGWITASDGLYRTTDRGLDWMKVSDRGFRKLCFISENEGWAIGGNGLISKTTDAGYTWVDQLFTNQDNFFSINFVDNMNGYITASFGKFFHTNNGGITWIYDDLMMERDFNIYDLAIPSPDKLIMAGEAGVMFKSFDRGITWESTDKYGFYSFMDMQFINDKTGWITGYSNSAVAYKSEDGGNTWIKKFEKRLGGLESVYFYDELNGWLVGDWGKIYRTRDGGESWDTLNAPEYLSFNDIQMFESGKGYLSTPSSAKIYKTQDFGDSWELLTVPVSIDYGFHRIFFNDEKSGWILSKEWTEDTHKLLKTSDGGENWEIAYEIHTSYLWDIYFSDINNGWVVGDSGIVLHTSNGGGNWEIYHSDPSKTNFRVYFRDENVGYITGSRGYIASTTDGGVTWESSPTWCNNNLLGGIYVFDDYSGIAFGNWGTILKNDDVILRSDDDRIENKHMNFRLNQNYPNPFNPVTTISYQIPKSGFVKLIVYNLLGEVVASLVNNRQSAGRYEVKFDGAKLASGVYIYRLSSGNYFLARKFILLK